MGEENIVHATVEDVVEMARIEQEAFSTPWSYDLLRAAVVNDLYDVRILRNGITPVIGFYIAHVPAERTLNLDNFAVETTLRGQGCGQRLLKDWIGLAHKRNSRLLSLQVNTKNDRARVLYERYGFLVVKLLTSYYPNGDDAFHMEVPLDSLCDPQSA